MKPTLVCKVMGAAFLLVAIWGFIDGHQVLIFHVNTVHNIVHLVSGLASLACGFAGATASRYFCLAFGAVYGLVAVLGFAGVQALVELLHLNTPDQWLHTAIAAIYLATGLLALPRRAQGHAPTPTPAA